MDEHCPGIFPKRRPNVAAAHAFMQDMFDAFRLEAEARLDAAEETDRFRVHPRFDKSAELRAAAHRMATAACEAFVANACANLPDEVMAIWTPRNAAAAEARAKEMAGVE